MIIEYVYPRFSYYSGSLSADGYLRYADIIDNENKIFLSSTGYVQRECYKFDTENMRDVTSRRGLNILAKILSNEYANYLSVLTEYIGDIDLIRIEPASFHKTGKTNFASLE